MTDWLGNLVNKEGTFNIDICVDPHERDFRLQIIESSEILSA